MIRNDIQYKCGSCSKEWITTHKLRRCPDCGCKLSGKIFNDIKLIETQRKEQKEKWTLFDRWVLPELAEKLGMTHRELLYHHEVIPETLENMIEEITI